VSRATGGRCACRPPDSNLRSKPRAVFRNLYRNRTRHLWTTSPEQGAEKRVFLAEGAPGVDFPSGGYFVDRKVAKPNEQAYDPALARELWDRSEAMAMSAQAATRHTLGLPARES